MNSIQYEQSLKSPSFLSNSASAPSVSNSAVSSGSGVINNVINKITSQSWTTWVIVILFLAFLGINIFNILGRGTQKVASLFQPVLNIFEKILKLLGFTTLETVKQTATVSATGVNTLSDAAADSTVKAANTLEQSASTPIGTTPIGTTPIGTTSSPSTAKSAQGPTQQNGSQIDYGQQNSNSNQMTDVRANTLERALNDAESHMDQQNEQNKNDGVEPDDSYSALQTGSKAGWCYIGEERGVRSCMEVGNNDQCMSGDIFPTNDVCVNPRLRA